MAGVVRCPAFLVTVVKLSATNQSGNELTRLHRVWQTACLMTKELRTQSLLLI
jgi:hypothetical protein